MRGPAAAALALAACGLLLLGAGQPWAATVTEAAPGAPRWPGSATASDLVPWLAPLELVAALAVLAALARLRWARYAALLALSAACAGAVLAVVRAGRSGDGTVSSHPTAWAWIGLGAVLLALLAVVLWRPGSRGGTAQAGRAPAPGPAWEEERRRTAQVWRELSRGEDPDGPRAARDTATGAGGAAARPPAGTMGPNTSRAQAPSTRSTMHDDDNHGHSPAAWTGVVVMLVAAAVACYAAVFGPVGLMWGGIVAFLAGGVLWAFLERFGVGAARSGTDG